MCLQNTIKVMLYVKGRKQNLYKPKDLTNKLGWYYGIHEGI